MISCAKHTIFEYDFCSGAQPPGAANDVHAEIEGCHCEPARTLVWQSPGYSGSLNRISRGRCPHRPKAKACAYISALNQCFNAGPSGGNVLVPARTLRRSRLRGRCRKAAPLSTPRPPQQTASEYFGLLWVVYRKKPERYGVIAPRGGLWVTDCHTSVRTGSQ